MSTLDDMMDIGRYYQEQKDKSSESVSYVGLKKLSGGPSDEVVCVECSKPIGSSFLRYGRPVKHTQLLRLMYGFRNKQISDNKQRYKEASNSLSRAKDVLLQGLAKVNSIPCPVPVRPIESRMKVQDGGFVGDLGEIASSYLIPRSHQLVWKTAVKPAEDVLTRLGQSLVERLPIKELTELLSQRSEPRSQSLLWRRKRAPGPLSFGARNPVLPPNDKEVSQVIRILGLESAVETGEEVNLSDIGSFSLVLSSIVNMAVLAMHAAGAESGWYWFVGDLLECCQAFKYQHKAMALVNCQTNAASIAGRMILEGFCQKTRWMTARPLSGMNSSKEYRKSLQDLEQAFTAELSEQRSGGHGPAHERLLDRLEKEMMTLLQEAL